jgi:hypothetical protein
MDISYPMHIEYIECIALNFDLFVCSITYLGTYTKSQAKIYYLINHSDDTVFFERVDRGISMFRILSNTYFPSMEKVGSYRYLGSLHNVDRRC